MYKTKLCLGVGGFGPTAEEQIVLFKQAGFDGFFTGWNSDLKKYRALADELGMIYQSVHAPFGNAAKMWKNDADAEMAKNELIACVRDTAEVKVPIVIIHPYIGFGKNDGPTACGIENFREVVNEARKGGVKVAFENVEGEEYLQALMDAFKDDESVGFCWDSGHELCYNRGKDMLALYGDRLIATHLNDNLGVSRFDGETFWTDDLHLLPFDGITDWQSVASRLDACGFDGILTFELTTKSKPNRHENDCYAAMPVEQYIAEVYKRACRVAALRRK
jgi:sugar phosphate isomerase/epimerase